MKKRKHKPLPPLPKVEQLEHHDGKNALLVIVAQWGVAIGRSGDWYKLPDDRAMRKIILREAITAEQEKQHDEQQWIKKSYWLTGRRVFVPLAADDIT